jgi:O-antigen ligase
LDPASEAFAYEEAGREFMTQERAQSRRSVLPPYGVKAHGQEEQEQAPLIVERVSRLHFTVALAFWAFMFSLPIDEASNAIGIPISMSKLFGYLFIFGTLVQPKVCFRAPPITFWWFFAYASVVLLRTLFMSADDLDGITTVGPTLAQMLVLLWLVCNLLRYEYVVEGGLRALTAACVFVAFLQCAGLGQEVDVSNYGREVRLTTFGQNANEQAWMLVLGLLSLTYLIYGPKTPALRPRWLAWPLFALLLLAIVQTGSRTGTLAMGAGMTVFLLLGGASLGRPGFLLRRLAILAIFLVIGLMLVIRSETSRLRWERTIQTGNTAGRTLLYRQACYMILERPLLGWGIQANRNELFQRTGNISDGDFQNVPLHVLAEVGLIGAVPFFIGTGCWLAAAWRSRLGPYGVLPLAMTVTAVITCMAGTWIYRKHTWIIIALCLVGGERAIRTRTWHIFEHWRHVPVPDPAYVAKENTTERAKLPSGSAQH